MISQNKNKILMKGEIKIFLLSFMVISISIANFFVNSLSTNAQEDDQEEIGGLNLLISEKRNEINVLQKEIDAYEAEIKNKQQEARGLRNQIAILDNQIAKVNLDIKTTEAKIEQTNLEIQSTNLQIEDTEENILDQKEKIGEYIRLIYKSDQVSFLELLLTNDSFSEFFDQIKYTQDIHQNLKKNVDKLKIFKNELEIQKSNWEAKALLEEELKEQLQEKRAELAETNVAQGILLVQARLTEKEYQNYSYQLKLEQQSANSDILSLEKKIRLKLEEREAAERFKGFGPTKLSWPVPPDRGISAYFHDPDYPFRYIFEHPAVDIRAYQGTPITAPDSGYVGRVKFSGNTSYAYVLLVHNDGLSTVFGHVSRVAVKEDEFVTKGQIVAYSGGAPGTTGAGNLSTGPHLHFEVRLNGIPVNPLEYLPKF